MSRHRVLAWVFDVVVGGVVGLIVGAIVAINFGSLVGVDYEVAFSEAFSRQSVGGWIVTGILLAGPGVGVMVMRKLALGRHAGPRNVRRMMR
jgi:hypothetical protein